MFLKPKFDFPIFCKLILCPREERMKRPNLLIVSLCVYLTFSVSSLSMLHLQKVRLISQPDFGHELRQSNLTIANLSGRVTQAELAERDARDNVDVMQRTIKSLEGELNDLQVFFLRYIQGLY